MGLMRKRAPTLSFETVVEELRTSPLLHRTPPERAYLVMDKHDQQIYLDTLSVDIEQHLESLISDLWVPLGFVAYYTDSPTPVTTPLNWYGDLMRRDAKRYGKVCGTVSARLEEGARRLTNQLSERRIVQRMQ